MPVVRLAEPLSPEAIRYRERRLPTGHSHLPEPAPDLDDLTAVAAWRSRVHASWGTSNSASRPHVRVNLGGVSCLLAGPSVSLPASQALGAEPSGAPVDVPAAELAEADALKLLTDSDRPVLVYAHGGGYVLGSPEVAIPITARLADQLTVVSVGYRLAPEHRFPAALDDVRTVFDVVFNIVGDSVRDAVGNGAQVGLGGDSAGGALALAAALATSSAPDGTLGGRAATPTLKPSAVVLFSPLLEHPGTVASPTQTGPSPEADPAASPPESTTEPNAQPSGEQSDTTALFRAYQGSASSADWRLSPSIASDDLLAALPPTLIQFASDEQQAAAGVRLTPRAESAGAAVRTELWDGLWHTWHYHRLPEADRALVAAGRFVADS